MLAEREAESPRVAPSIHESNLSVAWLRALEQATQRGVSALTPLVVTVTGFTEPGAPEEVLPVRDLIDAELAARHGGDEEGVVPGTPPLTCHAIANTIFPASLWNQARPRSELYARYCALLPTLRCDPRNTRGIYFERLINYPEAPENGNQLEHMIRLFERGVDRRSAYQAPIALPKKDSVASRRLGFPCLQQIALAPDRGRGTLAITGFYGTQYVFERAYGNYLGLCRLGAFLAAEMRLRLERMTCVAGYAPRDITQGRGRELAAQARDAVRAAVAAS